MDSLKAKPLDDITKKIKGQLLSGGHLVMCVSLLCKSLSRSLVAEV